MASHTGAFQVWYSILVAVVWVPLATLRAHDFLQGLLNSALFAIVSLIAQQNRGRALWHIVRPSPVPEIIGVLGGFLKCGQNSTRRQPVSGKQLGDQEGALLGGGLAGSVAHREPPACAWLPFCWCTCTLLFVFGALADDQPLQTNAQAPAGLVNSSSQQQ